MVLKALAQGDWVQVDWDQAACLGANPDLFFPVTGQNVNQARQVCRECPIVDPCGEYALRVGENFGVWGGMSERQRRRIGSEANQ